MRTNERWHVIRNGENGYRPKEIKGDGILYDGSSYRRAITYVDGTDSRDEDGNWPLAEAGGRWQWFHIYGSAHDALQACLALNKLERLIELTRDEIYRLDRVWDASGDLSVPCEMVEQSEGGDMKPVDHPLPPLHDPVRGPMLSQVQVEL